MSFAFRMSVKAGIAAELHKQARRNFPSRHVELKGVNDLYQADLVEMIEYAKVNKGFKYILTMINCFTKFAFAIPLKNKSASVVVDALRPILKQNKMKNLQTDDGKEWFNSKVRSLLATYGINHYSTYSDKKASIVERFNRTLKTKMWRKFTEQGSYRWVIILKDLLHVYNNSIHRTTGFKPVDVSRTNEGEVMYNIVNSRRRGQGKLMTMKQKYKVGDKVRISKYKKVFAKGYLPNWTNEVFTVHKVKPTKPFTYILQDGKGEILKGGFYTEELSKTKFPNTFLIEKVLKRNGDKMLVRWKGYNESYDSWIDRKNVV